MLLCWCLLLKSYRYTRVFQYTHYLSLHIGVHFFKLKLLTRSILAINLMIMSTLYDYITLLLDQLLTVQKTMNTKYFVYCKCKLTWTWQALYLLYLKLNSAYTVSSRTNIV